VALEKPSPRESTSWYFQRYIQHFPCAGEIVFFDRSWYNRSGVERVMGFCTESQHAEFLREVPMLENMILGSGISLTKFWFSVSQKEQRTRFAIRQVDPVRQWKLSPMDLASLDKWDDYTRAKEEQFRYTDTDESPWITIRSNDKKRARLNAMRLFLDLHDYDGKDPSAIKPTDPPDRAAAGVTYGSEFLRWFAEEAVRIRGDYFRLPEGHLQAVVVRRPVGPCLFITPWNFPLAMATRKAAPAFAAGNVGILKPSQDTPLTSLLFA